MQVLQQSKFCLAPSGMGFSTRSYESIAQGCVPLVIQPGVILPFEFDLLPYHRFALRFETRAVMGEMSNPKRVMASCAPSI